MGDGADMTTSEERRLGDRIIRELYRDPDYIDDAILNEYVQTLFQHLLKAARERGELSQELEERFAWEVLLGRDRTVNAFALPGGYFGVHLGLVGVVNTRDELASVLAHELSHVTQRHISRLMAQQSKQTPLMLGALVLGALAASKNPEAAQAMMVGGQALAVQNQLNFSRDMEREADRVGYGLMAPAGFAPQGFVSMFDKLQQANRINDNGSWPYLRSHPLSSQRMADMQSRLPQGAPPAPPPTLEHAMMAARARVLMRPGVDAWRQWEVEPRGTGFAARPAVQRAAGWYASVLSAVQLQDVAQAKEGLKGLDAVVQGDIAAMRQARLLAAEVDLAAGDARAAAARLAPASDAAKGSRTALTAADLGLVPAPTNSTGASTNAIASTEPRSVMGTGAGRPELVLRTQALLRTGSSVEMTGPLQNWVATYPRDAGAWQLLAGVWQQQGQPLRAVRAEAEAQAARYDYAAAVDRFKAGQDLSRKTGAASDYIEASIIDTRLRAMQSLLKEQAAER
ncbi:MULTISPECIES: M48 family metalloprotease [unclassified Acidovorax]|uniref:M48 family metalloprotease n=1 Tax=unclassified Acidovorax TaxID=2684926 RepID=UPI002882FDD2|nr:MULTISPECIES: M48 family metalloprotease [unclassified Acidovorax]